MRRLVTSKLVVSVFVGSCISASACGGEAGGGTNDAGSAGSAGSGGQAAVGGDGGGSDAGPDATTGGTTHTGGAAGASNTGGAAGASNTGGAAGSGGAPNTGGAAGSTSSGGTAGSTNCTATSKYCQGADIISCTAGQPPQVAATCKSAAHCTPSGCKDCLSGEITCSGNSVVSCGGNGTKTWLATCATTCDPVLGRCNDCPQLGQYCDGSTFSECGMYGEKSVVEQCDSAQSCSDGLGSLHCGCTTQSVTATSPSYQLTKIGSPVFKPIGMTLFAAPAGVHPTAMELIGPTVQGIYGTLHLMNATQNGLIPGIAHQPPYDNEIANGVAAKGYFVSNTFADCQMYPTSGVYVLFFVAPDVGAPMGKSADFDSGPIVPNSIFPMFLGQDLYREGVLVDPVGDGYFPASTAITPGTEGYSHLPVTWVTGMGWVPTGTPVKGDYSWKLDVIDKNGSGWTITVPFTVQ